MPSQLDPDLSSSEYIKALRAFMRENDVTVERLSEELELCIGTVRNWLYGNKDIPRKHKLKIAEVLGESEGGQQGMWDVAFLSVDSGMESNTALWCSAVGVPEYDFTKPSAPGEYTQKCAQWCAKVIMTKTQRIIKQLPQEKIDTIRVQLMRQDRKLEMRNDSRMKVRRGAHILEDCSGETVEASKLFIPVDIMEYKHYFVRVAAAATGMKHKQAPSFSKFIVSCLNSAASKAFNSDLERIRSQEE